MAKSSGVDSHIRSRSHQTFASIMRISSSAVILAPTQTQTQTIQETENSFIRLEIAEKPADGAI